MLNKTLLLLLLLLLLQLVLQEEEEGEEEEEAQILCGMAVPYHEASIRPPPPTPSNKWGPYSGAGDFSANMIVILIVLFCALFLALALNAIIRYLLCANYRSRRSDGHRSSDPEKPSPDEAAAPAAAESAPAQVFTRAGTELAGTDQADCAICLHEFADGDRVRVLPACSHGFHAGCVERWLRTKSSCPTCRTRCQVATGPAPAPSA